MAASLSLYRDDAAALGEAGDLEGMADRLEASHTFDLADIKYMKQRAWDTRRSREAGKRLYER